MRFLLLTPQKSVRAAQTVRLLVGVFSLLLMAQASLPLRAQGRPDVLWMAGGHTLGIHSVAASPDGTLLATGSDDSTVKVWNAGDGSLIRTLAGHTNYISSVAFSPDGQTLASASWDRTIKLWNLKNGSLLSTLTRHTSWIYSVAFSPDGQTLISASGDNTLKLWNVAGGRLLRTLTGHTNYVTSAAFAPNGQTVISSSSDHTLKLWRVSDGTLLRTFTGHSNWVHSAAFSPDGQTLASGDYDGLVKLWRVSTGKLIRTLTGHTGNAHSVAFSPDGQTLASASGDNTIKLWSVLDGTPIRTLMGHSQAVYSVAFLPDGLTLASGSQDNTFKLWNVSDGSTLHTLNGHSGDVRSVAFSSDGRTVATASRDLTMKIWNGTTGSLIRTLSGDFSAVMALSPDGATLAAVTGNAITLWNVADGAQIRTLTGHTGAVLCLAFSPDSSMLASGSEDRSINLWRVADGERRVFGEHPSGVVSVAFSPDGNGQTLASGDHGGNVRLWRVSSGALLRTLTGHSGDVGALSFYPDGSTLLSGGADHAVNLWRISDGRRLFWIPEAHSSTVSSIAFAPDGSTFATGSPDQTVRFWNTANGYLLRIMDQETAFRVNSVVYSSDGARIAYGRSDGTLVTARNPYWVNAFYVTAVSPARALSTSNTTLTVTGYGFTDGTVIRLTKTGSPDLVPFQSPPVIHAGRLQAEFRFVDAAPGRYTVVLTQPNGQIATLPNALEIVANSEAQPEIEYSFVGPDVVRPDRDYIASLTTTNAGLVPLDTPLFVLSNEQGAAMRFSDKEPWLNQPLFTWGGANGSLFPGQYIVKAWHYSVPSLANGVRLLFRSRRVIGIRPEAFANNWAVIQAAIRPPDIDDTAWQLIWARFTSLVGNDSASFFATLRGSAQFAGSLAVFNNDASQLLAYEASRAFGTICPLPVLASATDAAMPSPGLPLAFGRVAPNAIDRRFKQGIFGRGWAHSYAIRLRQENDGKITIEYPDGVQRRFTPHRGTWQPERGDYGKLTVMPGSDTTLREQDGTTLRFTPSGVLASIQDSNGNRLTLNYEDGRLVSIGHSSGAVLNLTYTGSRVAQITDSFGRATTYGYTGEYLTSVTASGGSLMQYAYHGANENYRAHALKQITAPDGTNTYYTYDDWGLLTKIAGDGGAHAQTFTYGAKGDVQTTNSVGLQTLARRGTLGQTAQAQTPVGNFRMGYDDQLNPTRIDAPGGLTYLAEFDAAGNAAAVKNPLGNIVRSSFNPQFNTLERLSNANGQLMRFATDGGGNTTAITHPNGSVERAEYDAKGNVSAVVNRRGQRITFLYTAFGQVSRKTYPDGRVINYGYDGHGNLNRIDDSLTGVIAMTYDARDFLTRIDYPGSKWFAFTHDNAGKRLTRSGSDSPTLTYGYDALGLLTSIASSDNSVSVVYTYDAAGRLTGETKGNGTTTIYGYDSTGRVNLVENRGANGTVQSQFAYEYDARSNPIRMTTTGGTWQYEYDATGQMTGVIPPNGVRSTATYDPEGNRLSTNDGGTVTPYTINNLNQYTTVGAATYTYDADGNIETRTDASGVTRYQWDAENRLIRVTAPNNQVWQYQYDGQGNRTAVTHNGITTRSLYEGTDLVAEYNAQGNLVSRYTHGAGLIARTDTSGAAYYAFDMTGNTRQITDGTGNIISNYDYAPFGKSTAATEAFANPFRFVGKYGVLEEAHGLHFMRARYYDAATGRFISPDPIGLEGEDTNLYCYVGNNPVSEIDPDGTHPAIALLQIAVRGLMIGGRAAYTFARPIAIRSYGYIRTAAVSSYDYLRSGIGNSPIMQRLFSMGKLPGKAGGEPFHWPSKGSFLYDWAHGWHIGRNANFGLHIGGWGRLTKWGTYSSNFHWYPLTHIYLHKQGFALGNAWLAALAGLSYWLYDDIKDWFNTILRPSDPNEKRGMIGLGPLNALQDTGEAFNYTISFENRPMASAPAQEVRVSDVLDSDLDFSTLELGEIVWDTYAVSDFTGYQFGVKRVPLRNSPYVVDIGVTYDPVFGTLNWLFRTIDPITNQLPTDATAGFLPPNDASGRGEGHVSFSIKPRRANTSSRRIENKATIVFDTEAAIVTNTWLNVIDPVAPSSQMDTVPNVARSTRFPLSWRGSDDLGGSGIAGYDIWVSDNGGDWKAWLANTTNTTAYYENAEDKHTYRFYSVARDWAGNVERAPLIADITVTVDAQPVIGKLSPAFVAPGSGAFTLTVSGANFVADSSVLWNGVPRPTFFVSENKLTVDISASDVATAGSHTVAVLNPGVPPVLSEKAIFVVGEPKIIATASLERTGGEIVVTLFLTNSGAVSATNVKLVAGLLASVPTATPLPITVGTLAAGQARTVTLRFPGRIGSEGTRTVLQLSGTRDKGNWGSSLRVTLP